MSGLTQESAGVFDRVRIEGAAQDIAEIMRLLSALREFPTVAWNIAIGLQGAFQKDDPAEVGKLIGELSGCLRDDAEIAARSALALQPAAENQAQLVQKGKMV